MVIVEITVMPAPVINAMVGFEIIRSYLDLFVGLLPKL
jgi:hypothetical protein